jgi:DNA-binding response OmpR family regulator
MNIALVEDDPVQSTLIQRWLESAGHRCRCYPDAHSFRRALTENGHQLLLLDWELPDHSGLEILAWLRGEFGDSLPVMFLTLRHEEQDIVQALRSGADDYLVKPAREQELLARIEALARRSPNCQERGGVEHIGPFTLDLQSRLLQRDGVTLELTHKEFALACLLLRNIGRLLRREELLDQVWGHAATLNTRTVDTHISRIRKKLSLVPEQGWQLSAIYQHGYRLDRMGPLSP